ncbi:hypothetical protein GN244_ATG10012 [Phytophthora infestans]|uniref:Uncharacterized protein n=1 Tax=Phytophthora infestans TaxID=4787 RepID=A0A833T5P2_PHYIN|nr:hypothetical protein GN244_ATG10012 [Phytophthora infestans]
MPTGVGITQRLVVSTSLRLDGVLLELSGASGSAQTDGRTNGRTGGASVDENQGQSARSTDRGNAPKYADGCVVGRRLKCVSSPSD